MADRRSFFDQKRATGALAKRVRAITPEREREEQHPEDQDSSSSSSVVIIDSDDTTPVLDNQLLSNEDNEEEAEDDSHDKYAMFDHMEARECFRVMAILKQVDQDTVEMMLAILRKKAPQFGMPKDPRTLVKTNRKATGIREVTGGKLWYNGLRHCLDVEFRNKDMSLVKELNLNFGYDGIPISESSSAVLWPLMVNVHEMPHVKPMCVSVFYGMKKPASVEEILRPFVEEANQLVEEGINLNGQDVKVKIRVIVADTEARTALKCVYSHNSLHGCQRCDCVGEHSSRSRTTAYPVGKGPVRTHTAFCNNEYPDHQRTSYRSPLVDLKGGFDIIRDVVVADRLHLIDHGVTRRLLKGRLLGKWGLPCWSDDVRTQISSRLLQIKLPSEINRPMRSLDNIGYWKATEYRSFLHYVGIVVLEDILEPQHYKHFLLYSCAITILSTEVYKRHWPLAGGMLQKFVEQYAEFFGAEYISSNLHNLLHVQEDVNKFGPLETISTYPFESAAQPLKRSLRHGHLCLEQISNRQSELDQIKELIEMPVRSTGTYVAANGIFFMKSFQLKDSSSDGWFLTRDAKIMRYIEARKTSDGIVISGKELTGARDYLHAPNNPICLNIIPRTQCLFL
ncbi:transposase domain-containing protein [Anopheles sinensis]|uniref:Transposase domain-containing protein n=1 Tax=Anopheles sinensis TaxID=74873 RepID=A0A084VCG4_ANOSI|nr:transposase domain-containing protein [Anopheles sinensis]